jgi:hypothetical protein
VSVTIHVPSQAGQPALESGGRRLAGLFPVAVYTRLTPVRAALAAVGVMVSAVVCLLRVTGTGPLQSIWEEDARDILDGALNSNGWGPLWRPVAGYFVLGPRLLGELTTVFPLSWAAGVLSISAAIITGLLALQVYCASEPFFPDPVAGRVSRVAVSAPLLIVPVAENHYTEVYDRPVCLHFFAMYALFWVLLWTPATTRGRISAWVTAGLSGFSTILIVGYLPLVGLRLLVRRDRYSISLAALVAAGSLTQGLGVWTGYASRGPGATTTGDPYWVLRTFAGWGLPTSVLGYRATSGIPGTDVGGGAARNGFVVAVAWLIVAGIIAVAVAGSRRGWLHPQWSLAIAAAVAAFGLYAMTAVANGGITYRYLIPVNLLIIAAAIALLQPARHTGGAIPLMRTAGCALVVLGVLAAAAFNYRWADTYRSHAPLWTDQVRLATQACHDHPRLDDVIVRGAPLPWWSIVHVPCHDLLRLPASCTPPQCEWLNPPVGVGPLRGRYEP